MAEKIELGDEIKCKLTGLQGIAICRKKLLFGMDQIGVQPPVKDGNSPDITLMDEYHFEILTKQKVPVNPETDEDQIEIQIGDKAKDPITGAEGTIISMIYWISGCTLTDMDIGFDKNGKMQDQLRFSAPRLKFVGKRKKEEEHCKRKAGGPSVRIPQNCIATKRKV